MKKKWLIIAPIILILTLFISLPILAVSKPYTFDERKSTDLVNKFIKSEKLGTITATEDEINGLINTYLEKQKNSSKILIEKANIKIDSESVKLIAQISNQKYSAQIFLEGVFELDGEYIYFNPSRLKVGRLYILKSIVFDFLKDKQADFIQDEKIKFPKDKFPVDITKILLEPNQVTVNFTKKENLIFSKEEKNENNQNASQNKNSNDKTQKTDKKIILINKLNSQLNKTISNLKLKEQKQIIYQIQNTLNAMIKNPKYDYKKDIPKVRAIYDKLTPQQKEEFKQVLFNNVSLDLLFELKAVYGM